MFQAVCKKTFHISHVCIFQNSYLKFMWNLWHIVFMWTWYHEILPQIKSYYVLEQTFSKGDIQNYTDISFQSASDFLYWVSRNGANGFFWQQTETCLLKNLRNKKGFWLFLGIWDFLLENLKSKKIWDNHWKVCINIKALSAQNNILKKKNSKYELLSDFYFCSNLVLWGTILGRFCQWHFFWSFYRRPTMVANIFI